MRPISLLYLMALNLVFLTNIVYAEVEIEMDTTIIKGNTELPKILYIVPWKEIRKQEHDEQELIIHSLYGDLFDPVTPPNLSSSQLEY